MKTIDIALKDLRRMFTSAFFLAFGLVLPLATAGLFYFAFGGMSSGNGGFDLAPIPVVVANLDRAEGGLAAGDVLAGVLEESLPGLIQASRVEDAAAARSAVDRQQAAVAVIIPEGLSAAVIQPDGRAAVEIYQDPTLSLGPGIVQGLVRHVVDAFAGAKIATQVTAARLAAHGSAVDGAALQNVAQEYSAWAAGGESDDGHALLAVRAPAGSSDEGTGPLGSVLGQIMAGMMVFYVFFSGAAAAESILQEDEAGTLPRLFTTPTPQPAILAGKFLSTFLLLGVQVTVLLVVSALIFDIDWGQPLLVGGMALGLVIVATGFGLLITSLMRDRRQAGIIYGGVLTVMGMLGMIGVFTAGVQGADNPLSTASLIVPQGWAVRGWQLLLTGAGSGEVIVPMAVMLVAGAVFFILGAVRFQKRFA